jgi:hypothetical protein
MQTSRLRYWLRGHALAEEPLGCSGIQPWALGLFATPVCFPCVRCVQSAFNREQSASSDQECLISAALHKTGNAESLNAGIMIKLHVVDESHMPGRRFEITYVIGWNLISHITQPGMVADVEPLELY